MYTKETHRETIGYQWGVESGRGNIGKGIKGQKPLYINQFSTEAMLYSTGNSHY